MGVSLRTQKRRLEIVQLIMMAIRLGAPVTEACQAYNMPVRRFANLAHFAQGWYAPEMFDAHAATVKAVFNEIEAARQQTKEDSCSTE